MPRLSGLLVLVLLGARATAAPAIPSPEEVFGFRPGADRELADYPTIVAYYETLAAASDRVVVEDIGPTAEGRRMIAAIITSEANQRRLGRLKQISRQLALAKDLDDRQAQALAAEGRAFVWIDSGLHASEVAHAQHAPELAYRLATEDSEELRRIRDNVVLVQLPVMNPDGLDRVVAWYRRNLGTPYEVAPMVELYHRHAGHDNNRDWFMFNLPESRNVARLLYEEYFPQIVYNHHQTAPFPARIFVPPFADPMNPNIPPQVMRGIQLVGSAITARLEKERKRGAVSRMHFDTWWNGGMRTAPYFHNMVGILTETALWYYATPHEYDPEKLPETFQDGTPTDTPTTFYPSPWSGGWWRLRDAVEYMLSASLATLDVAAAHRQDWLYGMYVMGRAAIEAGERGHPYAYVISSEQRDPGTAAVLLNTLRRGGVEIQRAQEDFSAEGHTIPAGSYVVRMDQAFRAYAKDLLEVQRYPEQRQGGPVLKPYDVSGWTLPAQMGVETVLLNEPFEARLEPVGDHVVSPGDLTGSGDVFLIGPRSNAAFLAVNRALRAGGRVWRAQVAFEAQEQDFEPGTFVIEGGLSRTAIKALATEHGLVVTAVSRRPEVEAVGVSKPRIGLHRPWRPSIDEGWTRWVLERFEFPYTTLTDGDIRKGDLGGDFDVVILADSSHKALLEGYLPGMVPPEYAGGLGLEGALALKSFVERGGTLLALGSATELPLGLFGLGVRNVLEDVSEEKFSSPGALLRVELDAAHPLGFGLPRELTVFFAGGPAFEKDGFRSRRGEETRKLAPTGRPEPKSVAQFVEKDVLYSGWLRGEAKLARKSVLMEVPFGRGRVVLVGFHCQFRGQAHGTFKILFNALL